MIIAPLLEYFQCVKESYCALSDTEEWNCLEMKMGRSKVEITFLPQQMFALCMVILLILNYGSGSWFWSDVSCLGINCYYFILEALISSALRMLIDCVFFPYYRYFTDS